MEGWSTRLVNEDGPRIHDLAPVVVLGGVGNEESLNASVICGIVKQMSVHLFALWLDQGFLMNK